MPESRKSRYAALLLAGALLALPVAGTARQQGEPVHGRMDPARYRYIPSHQGAGAHFFQELLGRTDIYESNFLWVHRARIPPKSGIGLHVQRGMEDMFWALNMPAEFTVNGRTAYLPARSCVLCPLGSYHGIYNPSEADTLEFINIAVSLTRDGNLGIVDFGDDLTHQRLESPAPFRWNNLDTTLLADIPAPHGGRGMVKYRRLWDPSYFGTPWRAVDHYIIPSGSSMGRHTADDCEEIWYVIRGSGTITVNGTPLAVRADDAVPVTRGDTVELVAPPGAELELFVMLVETK